MRDPTTNGPTGNRTINYTQLFSSQNQRKEDNKKEKGKDKSSNEDNSSLQQILD
jgi:hypothetical protein